jgi:hypothetical protein
MARPPRFGDRGAHSKVRSHKRQRPRKAGVEPVGLGREGRGRFALRYAIPAARKPGVAVHGHPFDACVEPVEFGA